VSGRKLLDEEGTGGLRKMLLEPGFEALEG
jgi:hypothetical protein